MSSNLIELLAAEQPQFHLKSLTEEVPMYIEDFFFRKKKADTQGMPRTSYDIDKNVLNYISSVVKSDSITLETGCGYSTVIFAANAKKHICVNPDITSNQLVKEWLQNKNYSCDGLHFVEDSSDMGLAKLTLSEPIDVALIDGNHCFPFPIIDWHFIDLFLKVGSKVLVDDTQINAVKILSDFLSTETSYKKIEEIGRCDVFEKISDTRVMGWSSQEINKIYWSGFSETKKQEKSSQSQQSFKSQVKQILPTSLVNYVKKIKKRIK